MSEVESGSSTFFVVLGVCIGLVLLAGLVSGLTLGLMSLDLMNLSIMKVSGDAKTRRYARKIYSVVEHQHLLLVTLLLINAVANEALPIFLDMLVSPVVAIILSVTAVLIFGEVIPQALCSRYGLAIGANLAWLVKGMMAVVFIIAYPIAKILDCLLGEKHSTFFRRAELKELVAFHEGVTHGGPLSEDECKIVRGALEMRDKVASSCMTPLDSVFMLPYNGVMDRATMKLILNASHSRIPVYKDDHHNIVGVLIIKTLIMLDPDDATPISTLNLRPFLNFREDMALDAMLNEFQLGKSHLAVIEHGNDIIGVVTLEDVLEELIQEEIVDETDVFVDVARGIRVACKLRSRRALRVDEDVSTGKKSDTKETTPLLSVQRGETDDTV